MKMRVRGKGKRVHLTRRQKQLIEYRPWVRYYVGRLLQITGLVVTLVAMTAFFGSRNTTAMLRMMLIGVALFLPGWWLARKNPRSSAGPP